jgi:hypothetical protein
MSVVVRVGTVDTGERVYLSGEVIDGLSDKDEKELVELGVAQYTGPDPTAEDPEDEEPDPEDEGETEVDADGLKKLKGGFYELPNGEKVRGRDKALEALATLNQSDDDKPDEQSHQDEEAGPATGILGDGA